MRFAVFLSLLAIVLLGCNSSRSKYVTIKTKLVCADSPDSLTHVLISNNLPKGPKKDYEWLEELIGPETRYVVNLKRSADGCFYIDSVERGEYFYFYAESTVWGYHVFGIAYENDFSKSDNDTIEKELCFDGTITPPKGDLF